MADTASVRTDRGRACRFCRHFRNDGAFLEAALPGIAALSSPAASVRSDDGICALRGRMVRAGSVCGAFAAGEPRLMGTGLG